jgi:hypothetical protein
VLRQCQPGHLDVLGRGVRSGVAGAQQDGQRLPARSGAVVGERGRRMEPERLIGESGFLLLRVREHDRGVDVDGDQAPLWTGAASRASAQARFRADGRAVRIALSASGASAASVLTSREITGSEATGPASSDRARNTATSARQSPPSPSAMPGRQ